MTTPVEEREHWEQHDPADLRQFSSHLDDDYGTDTILRALDPPDLGTLVDLGCGPGRLAFAITAARPDLRIDGFDPVARHILLARHRARESYVRDTSPVRFFVNDSRTLSGAYGNKYDGVYSMQVFQHLDDETCQGYLAEIARVLRPRGRFAVQFVVGNRHAPHDHQRSARTVIGWAADLFQGVALAGDPTYREWWWLYGTAR